MNLNDFGTPVTATAILTYYISYHPLWLPPGTLNCQMLHSRHVVMDSMHDRFRVLS